MVVDTISQGPANETCDDADDLIIEGGHLEGDTSGANDDYQLLDANLCTGHNTLGGDFRSIGSSPKPGDYISLS